MLRKFRSRFFKICKLVRRTLRSSGPGSWDYGYYRMSFSRRDVSAKKSTWRELVIFTERELEVLKQFYSLSRAWVYCLEKQFRHANKVSFTACHLGKLQLACTSSRVISLAQKIYSWAGLITVLLLCEFPKKNHLPIGQDENRIH